MSAEDMFYVVESMEGLDGWDFESGGRMEELTDEEIEIAAICHAYDRTNLEVGRLAIDAKGRILIVEVEPEYPRSGIASEMLRCLIDGGYSVEHDWDKRLADGTARVEG